MVSPVGDDYFSSGKFVVPQNRYALCGFYVVLWDGKSGAEFFYSDTALLFALVCVSSTW